MVSRWTSIHYFTCLAFWVHMTQSISSLSRRSFFFDNSNAENDLTDLIYSKPYYPKEKSLPKNTIVKDADDDVTYLISKLSDDELMKLLSNQPKKTEFDLNDIAKIIYNSQPNLGGKFKSEVNQIELPDSQTRYNIYNKANLEKEKPTGAFFKLDHMAIDPYKAGSSNDHDYKAMQKLNDFLYNYPQTLTANQQSTEDIVKKEQLFDVLVSQLKTLCCKKSINTKPQSRYQFMSKETVSNEYIFLIVNDEIKSNASDELISVDPDSLAKNSSVLLLGPISSPLSDGQLKFVVSRIAGELSKPEYLPLLHQLADGSLSDQNMKIMKSLVSGPETRRYIKPHRCNHQSKLAKVYGGPKWLVCTGYLNVNGPSLYD